MSRKVIKIIKYLIGYITNSKEYKFKKQWIQEVKKWNDLKNDKSLRITYPLTEKSIVFDIGGYEGQWASDIYAKYNCTIHIFEPVRNYYSEMSKRFKKNLKLICINAAAGNYDGKTTLSIDGERSSLYEESEAADSGHDVVKVINLSKYIKKNRIGKIALIKINIEGGEYDLIDSLISTGTIKIVTDLQVQFHYFMKDSIKRRLSIRKRLSKTHVCQYNYPFVWESWHKKS